MGKDLSLQRGGICGVSIARFGGQIANDHFSRCLHGMCYHTNASFNEKVSKPIVIFHGELKHCYPVSQKSIQCMNMKPKGSRRCQCYLSSDPCSSSHIEQRAVNGLGLSKTGKANTDRVHYKSEEYDVAEAKLDSLASTEGTGEAILMERNVQQVSPWWQQFPKRWIIVLLCFAAFLLCNMDRVSILFWNL